MSQRQAVVLTALGKLEEASLFLSEMRRAEDNENLEESEKRFQSNLFAFLTATRSALQTICAQEGAMKNGKDNWDWVEQAKKGWGGNDQHLFARMTALRNDAIHRGTPAAHSTIEYRTTWERSTFHHTPWHIYFQSSQPPGVPEPRIGVRRFSILIQDSELPASQCASGPRHI